MHRGFKKLSSMLLSAVLAAPLALMASAQDRDDRNKDHDKRADNAKRYYDKRHKDYHNWDDNEGRAYQRYQAERNEKREFTRLNSRQQASYWDWRHTHPDTDRDRDRR